LERVKAPSAAVESLVGGSQAATRSDRQRQEQLAFDAGDMERALRRRLVHHRRVYERKAARVVLQRALIAPLLARCWLKWAASDTDAGLVDVQRSAERLAAAVELQRVARGHRARRIVGELRRQRAVRCIERFVKAGALGMEVRRRVTTKRRLRAAERIQRAVRVWRVRMRTAQALLAVRRWTSARKLQAVYRGHCGRREAGRRRQERRRTLAATDVERAARGWLARREAERRRKRRVESRAACVIQTRWRTAEARVRVGALRAALEEEQRQAEALARRCAAERINRSVRRWWADWKRRWDEYEAHRLATAARIQWFVARRWRWRQQRRLRAKALAVVARVVLLAATSVRLHRQLQQEREQQEQEEKVRAAASARIRAAWRSHRLLLAVRSHVQTVRSQQQREQSAARRLQTWHRRRQRRVAAREAEDPPGNDGSTSNDVLIADNIEEQQATAATALQSLFRRRRARQEVERRKALLRLLSSSSGSSRSVCEDCRAAHCSSVLSSPPLLLRLCAACASQRLAPPADASSTLLWDAKAFDSHVQPGVSTLQRRYRARQSQRAKEFGLCAICGSRAARRVCRACRRPSAYDSVHLPCCLSCDAVVHGGRSQRLAGHARVSVELYRYSRRQAARTIQRGVRSWRRRRKERAVLDAMRQRATRVLARAVDRKRRQRLQRLEAEAARRTTREKLTRLLFVAVRVTGLADRARNRVRRREEARLAAAAGCIQRAFRRWRSVRRWRSTAAELSQAAIRAATTIQRRARGVLSRKHAALLRAAEARRRQEDKERRERAAMELQRHLRGFLARRDYHRQLDRRQFVRTLAAKRIQRQWRAHRQYELRRTGAAATIQSCARRHLAQQLAGRLRHQKRLDIARRAREALLSRCLATEHASASRIQRAVRRRLTKPASRSRTRVQHVARLFLMRRAMQQLSVEVRAARRLQRAFRLSRATRRLSQRLETSEGVGGRAEDAWVELLDESSGCVYYYNLWTKASSWERPPEMDGLPSETTEDPPTSAWVEYWDENVGAAYYYNVDTGEATWAPPPELASRLEAWTGGNQSGEAEVGAAGGDWVAFDGFYGGGPLPAPSKLAWGPPEDGKAADGANVYDYSAYYDYQPSDHAEGQPNDEPDATYATDYRIYVTQLDQQQQEEGGGGTDGDNQANNAHES
jgi:hypothetical protein